MFVLLSAPPVLQTPMSFATLSSSQSNLPSHANIPPPAPSSASSSTLTISNTTLSSLSDSITTYQRNVSLLQPLITSPTQDSATQFPILLSVADQLRAKCASSLASARSQVSKMERQDASKFRGVLVKLSRDFERVEREQEKLKNEYQRNLKLKTYSDQQQREEEVRSCEERSNKMASAYMLVSLSTLLVSNTARTFACRSSQGRRNEPLAVKQPEFVLKQEEDIQSSLVADRHREIIQINQEMSKVNEIFKDLAGIVDGQQEEIDNIESLMEQSNVHARKGLEQVQEANEYQKGCTIF
ncbi:hypothetical protein TL16_g08985 [Triparma laevis f. inornata]|uniref:t-SNARE coiled-coil homology domain-containing protein n=1 Tax=Triparma laevis f. inornata TaxID=1714386 RepID=A0A9W7EJS7_9STRA|nr:hypothetical protein TL16_g08985 [Triparma laevis f. inornata]